MNESQAELTTVISHLPDGRIHQFVKTPIRLADAEQMRVKARLEAEEFRAKVVLEKTDAVLASVAPAPAPAARPIPQQRTAPRAPAVMARAEGDPIDAIVPARDALVPARVVAAAKRKQQLAALEGKRAALLAQAKALISAKTKEAAAVSGRAIGRAVMNDLIERVPPGHMAANVDRSLDEIMGRSLQQLREQKWYPTASYPEFGETFAKSFWLGAAEVVTEYNSKHKQPAPCQPEE
jgi:hypothetical protein